MKLFIDGSSIYPMEQLSAMLIPNMEGEAVCSVKRGKYRTTVDCRVNAQGKEYSSRTWVTRLSDEHETVRLERRAVARAFYKSILPLVEHKPEWGMLSGVRPAKLTRMVMENGGSEKDAAAFLEKEYFVNHDKALLCARAGRISHDANQSLVKGDFSLYVHIPFCPTRCSYCSFVSNGGGAYSKWGDDYFVCLMRELDFIDGLVHENNLRGRSIYIGGGTPTILEPDKLEKLCTKIRKICPDADEFTIESGRPDSISEEKLKIMKSFGVNRICVNPQTMKQATLDIIGRRHSPEDVINAYNIARKVGIENINCDLIAGLPEESLDDFISSLDKVIALNPENITVHTLAIKRSSTMNENMQGSASPELLSAMLDYAKSVLTKNGYLPYYLYRQKYTGGGFENVGWSKPGHECFYNICMMEEIGDIISAGAGASTKLTGKGFLRITNPKYPDAYIKEFDTVTKHIDTLKEHFKND